MKKQIKSLKKKIRSLFKQPKPVDDSKYMLHIKGAKNKKHDAIQKILQKMEMIFSKKSRMFRRKGHRWPSR